MALITAICILHGLATGSLKFMDTGASTSVKGQIIGLPPNAKLGFHIHQFGDMSDSCKTMGGHYNPRNMHHGGPTEDARHAGDLGNILSNRFGAANVDIRDSKITLRGPESILGRGCVVHAGMDDYGRGGHPDSLTTGNAGARIGCGVVALSQE